MPPPAPGPATLRSLCLRELAALESWTARRHWRLVATGAATALSLALAFPGSRWGALTPRGGAWDALEQQVRQPFRPMEYPPQSHQSKMAFRLAVPLFVRLTGVGMRGAVVLHLLSGVALLYLTLCLAFSATEDRVTAALTALAAASTFLGASAFWDARGYFDALAIGLVLAAMACRAVAPVALLVLLAAFTDERALGAGLLACFWFVVRGRREGASGRARWLPRPAWGVLLATAAYVGARQVLARRFGLATPIGETAAVGLDQLRGQLTSMPFGVWSVLEGLWLPVLAGFALLWRRWRLPSGIVILVLALQLLSAHCVWDVTRSGMYVFPVVFVSAAALARVETPDTVRALFLLATLVCVLAPTGHLQANEVHLCRPVTAWIALSLW